MTDCIVLGAGMVGICTALALQERGRNVVVVDRRQPGQEASYGNAGIIQSEAVEPYGFPRNMWDILSVALKRGNDVDWRWRDIPQFAGPLYRYFNASAPQPYERAVAAYRGLILRASDDHSSFIAAAGADDLIARKGWQAVYRSQNKFENAARQSERLAQIHGVPSRIITGSDLRSSEPTLCAQLAGAIHWSSPWTCCAPGELVGRYASLFVQRGGQIFIGDAATLHETGNGWSVTVDEGMLTAPDVVVALGSWSPMLLKRWGYRIPMVFKSGYHRHFNTQSGPRLATLDVENATFMAPMKAGLRVLTGAHLSGPGANSATRQMSHATQVAAELFELGAPVEDTPWRGTRPCMPDMLPVVGRANRHKGLWFNFGHGHQGFTLGATTGQLLAERMGENHINPLIVPLDPSRLS